MCGRSPSRCFQGFSITMRTTRCTWATSCGHRIDFRILRGEDNCVDYASYLVNTSVRGSWLQRARLGVVTELMIPAQCPRMLKDRRGGRHVLRRLPREPRPGVPDREWQGVGGGHHGAGDPPRPCPTEARGDEARGCVKGPTETRDTAGRYRFALSLCQGLVLASRSRA